MDNITLLSQLYGQGLETVRRLKEAGISKPEDLLGQNPEMVSKITGLSLSQARVMLNAASEMIEGRREDFKGRLSKLKVKGNKKRKERMMIPMQHGEDDLGLPPLERTQDIMAPSGVLQGEAESLSECNKKEREDTFWPGSFWRFGS